MPTTLTPASTQTQAGRVTQIIGSTFDAEFPEDHLPPIYNAVQIEAEQKGVKVRLTGEVQAQLGGGRVRCVALGSTDGMVRGMACIDTGAPVRVPVGKATLGRVFNLLGEPIDERGPVNAEEYWPIHRDAPAVVDLSTKTEIFETGIKVIDLLTPFVRGGKAGLVRRRRTGQDGHPAGADRPHRLGPRRFLRVRRRRRADPRRQRPVAGNAARQDRQHGPQRHRPDVHGLRPDERAARRPSARGPCRP